MRLQPVLDWEYIDRFAGTLGWSRWCTSVAIDSDQVLLDRRLVEAGLEGRRAAHDRLRATGFARVWAQADRAGSMTELELARFLLRRLYPDLEGERLDAIMAQLETEWQAGTWTGFSRPATLGSFVTVSSELEGAR